MAFESIVASRANRSETVFNCTRLGRMIWTSGSRHRGSCRPCTASSWSTLTGTSCDMTVSRSRGPVPAALASASPRPNPGSASETPMAFLPAVQLDASTVNASNGTFPFLVRRSCAEVVDAPPEPPPPPPIADRRARCKVSIGTSRLIEPVLELRLYVAWSKMASYSV